MGGGVPLPPPPPEATYTMTHTHAIHVHTHTLKATPKCSLCMGVIKHVIFLIKEPGRSLS